MAIYTVVRLEIKPTDRLTAEPQTYRSDIPSDRVYMPSWWLDDSSIALHQRHRLRWTAPENQPLTA